MRPSMATPLTKTFLNRWTPATPVRADFGRWVAYLSTDAAAVRAAAGARGGVIDARARLIAGAPIEHRDGSTYRLVSRPGE
jgi:hypothetical protein